MTGSIGERIRQRRRELGLTQPRLAKVAGVSERTVQNWESGRTPVSTDVAPRLAQALHVDVDELLHGLSRRDVERAGRLRGRTPGERLLELLAQERAAGASFDTAWERCVPLTTFRLRLDADDERDWQTALAETRPAWERAYRGEPAGRRERALGVVADDPDRGEPEPDRVCELCDGAIPPERGRHARRPKFCSDACRKRADALRRRDQIAAAAA